MYLEKIDLEKFTNYAKRIVKQKKISKLSSLELYRAKDGKPCLYMDIKFKTSLTKTTYAISDFEVKATGSMDVDAFNTQDLKKFMYKNLEYDDKLNYIKEFTSHHQNQQESDIER